MLKKTAAEANPNRDQGKSVEDHLKHLITKGELAPGQRVTEAEVMKETGSSRARVRQAFQRLAVEGIMTIEEFRGASVKRLGKPEIIQLYEVREVLEGLAARGAAAKATAKAKKLLVRLQTKMDTSEKNGDWATFVKLNQQWHQEITNACGNAYVGEVMNRLNVPINRMLSQVFPRLEEIAIVNNDHRAITNAILEGAEETAEKLMRRHIRAGFMLRRVRALPEAE